MKWISWIKYPILIVITSLYFFPFEFTFLPGMNTKMILAAVGLVWFIAKTVVTKSASLNKYFMLSALLAAVVSLVGLVSVVYNGTQDYTYASYIVSFAVWMGGAYFVISAIRLLHGDISADLVIKYLVAVCVAQCICALLINNFPVVKSFVDGFLKSEGFMGKVENRMYGIGAALDVAGEKFGVVLVAIVAMVKRDSKDINILHRFLLGISFVFIAIVGNMIGRTTTVGLVIALIYLFGNHDLLRGKLSYEFLNRISPFVFIIVIALPIIILGYHYDKQFRYNIRFGFEGFFSLAEKGRWETNSNDRLSGMVVWPDNAKTWVIGDGYFDNPEEDPNYIGSNPTEYYKGTDIGYLRFIFYFGIIGMLTFVFYFWKVSEYCRGKFPEYAVMFLMVLAINYMVWFKVSSDIFVFFALFLCLPQPDSSEEEDTEQIEE